MSHFYTFDGVSLIVHLMLKKWTLIDIDGHLTSMDTLSIFIFLSSHRGSVAGEFHRRVSHEGATCEISHEGRLRGSVGLVKL